MHQAAESITGCHEHDAKGRNTSKPTFTSDTVTYDSRTMTLFEDGTVSLSTIEDRVRIPLALPEAEDGYQHQFIESDDWELTESTLSKRDGSYYLHLGFRRFATETEREAANDHENEATIEDGTVLGVDLGVANLAVTSTGLFISGDELTHWQREYENRRASMQQTDTRWAHRNMQRVGRKEDGQFTIILHEVSNAIITEAKQTTVHILCSKSLTVSATAFQGRRGTTAGPSANYTSSSRTRPFPRESVFDR